MILALKGGNMLRILIATVWLAVVGAPSAHADQFVLKDANAVASVCVSKDYLADNICFTYVAAVAEMYFLSNPSCPHPDSHQFMGAVLENIIATTKAMNPQQLANETSVNVVYQAIAKAHPCQIVEKSNAPNPEACKAGFAALGNAWIRDVQKQAILELLRNKRCLN